MRSAIQWEPPARASAHLALRQAAAEERFDDLRVRELLRLINAHPRLVAHARVFSNITALLTEMASGSVGPLGPWGIYLDEWIRFSRWTSDNASKLSCITGLADFDLQPIDSTDHPLLGEGVDRHGVVTALWNRHELTTSYPPDASNLPAWHHFRLQAHLLYSYIDARWRWVPLTLYENYTKAREDKAAPAWSGNAARAVREFSNCCYDTYLSTLDSGLAVPDFYKHITKIKGGKVNVLTKEERDQAEPGLTKEEFDRAELYLAYLKRYFRKAWRSYEGHRPRTSTGGGGGGGPGRRKHLPGFVGIPKTGLILKKPPKGDFHDPEEDVSPPVGELYFGDVDAEDGMDGTAMEESGLSPSEDIEPVLELVGAEAYASKMYGVQYAHLAREMAAQSYRWDWNQLGNGELRTLWESLAVTIAAAYQNPRNKANARYDLIAALMLKIMLLYGQPFEQTCNLKIKFLPANSGFTPTKPGKIEQLTLLIQGSSAPPSATDQVIGFGLPAVSPTYQTTQDPSLATLSRQLAHGLLLPDVSNLGQQLLTFYLAGSHRDERIFHIDRPTALKKIKALLKPMDARITVTRICKTMPALLTQQTGDASLVWMTLCMRSHQEESRMHYTMHRVGRIRKSYARAASTLLRRVGYTPAAFTPESESVAPTHIGCRFVLKRTVLKGFVSDLKQRLTCRYLDTSDLSRVLQYDRDYLFYTYLLLTLSTGVRANQSILSPYLQWQSQGQPKTDFRAGQSDKESIFFDKARLIPVLPVLAQQFRHYLLHIETLMSQLGQTLRWKSADPPHQLLVTFDEKQRPAPLSTDWIEKQFKERLGAPVPSNFSRAFLRTELLERLIPVEIVDAFLGHFSEGESPFAQLSTFDYEHYITVLAEAIAQILNDLEIEPVESRLVSYPTRLGTR